MLFDIHHLANSKGLKPQTRNPEESSIFHKIFETNSSFHVK